MLGLRVMVRVEVMDSVRAMVRISTLLGSDRVRVSVMNLNLYPLFVSCVVLTGCMLDKCVTTVVLMCSNA